MFVTASNLTDYLLERGFVSPDVVLEEPYFVVEIERRNRNFKVRLDAHSGLFVKQVKSLEPAAIATLDREARYYAAVHDSPHLSPAVRALLPSLRHYDEVRRIVITDLIPDATMLAELHARDPETVRTTSSRLGSALAILHRELPVIANGLASRGTLPAGVPWALTLDRTGYGAIEQFGPIGVQLSQMMQAVPGLTNALAMLRAIWSPDTIVHGDIKSDNLLVNAAGMKIIDWELVDVGDSAWDVASVIKEHLVLDIFARVAAQSQPPAGTPMDFMAAAREFFNAYIAERPIGAPALPQFAGKCVRYTAARLMMAILEYYQASPALDEVAATILRTGVDLLRQPSSAAWMLLNVPSV
ncbi:MAG TPA: phosphotransferase [Vicinamibacterales bacterium]|nr:phosphotransferase [Vicinamibacterales bacterium]